MPELPTGGSLIIQLTYGSEQSRVNPQFRQMILQLRSCIRFPQISQSNPSSRLGGRGAGVAVRWLLMA